MSQNSPRALSPTWKKNNDNYYHDVNCDGNCGNKCRSKISCFICNEVITNCIETTTMNVQFGYLYCAEITVHKYCKSAPGID